MLSEQKPAHLYHGSCQGIDGDLAPRFNHGDINGNFPEGPRNVVFATHERDLAALYSLKTPHMLSTGVTNGMNFSFLRDYEGWKNQLASAACNVYELPSATFTNTLSANSRKPSIEWQSPVNVTPTNVIHQTPESVMQTGAQLFFLDPEVTSTLWHYDPSKPAEFSFLNRITEKQRSGVLPASYGPLDLAKELIDAGIMTHLNAQTGIKPITLEKKPSMAVIGEDIDWLKGQMEYPTKPRADGKPWGEALGKRGAAIGI